MRQAFLVLPVTRQLSIYICFRKANSEVANKEKECTRLNHSLKMKESEIQGLNRVFFTFILYSVACHWYDCRSVDLCMICLRFDDDDMCFFCRTLKVCRRIWIHFVHEYRSFPVWNEKCRKRFRGQRSASSIEPARQLPASVFFLNTIVLAVFLTI